MMLYLNDGTTIGNLVIKDNHVFPFDIAHNSIDYNFLIADALFAARCHRQFQQTRELRGFFGAAKVGRDYDRIAQVAVAEVAHGSRAELHAQICTYLGHQFWMGVTTKNRYLSHLVFLIMHNGGDMYDYTNGKSI